MSAQAPADKQADRREGRGSGWAQGSGMGTLIRGGNLGPSLSFTPHCLAL